MGRYACPGLAFDTDKYFIVCCNILGSCYGSTGPGSPIPGKRDGAKFGMDFPDVSVKDTVKLQLHMFQDDLKISSIKCVVGGSHGGFQAVEYAAQAGIDCGEFVTTTRDGRVVPYVRSVMPIACGPEYTTWNVLISEVQRQAIRLDPKWNNGNPSEDDPPLDGLSLARQIGFITYRTREVYENQFGRQTWGGSPEYGARARWKVKSYLEHQGHKFSSRFDPVTYLKLTDQTDSYDVGRGRGGQAKALCNVHIPAKVLAIDSDMVFPLSELEKLACLFPNGELSVIRSDAGHDGFLLEQDQIAEHISDFLASHD